MLQPGLNRLVLPALALGLSACDPPDSFDPHAAPGAPAGDAELVAAADDEPLQACGSDINIDLRRSLVLSEFEILEPFTFTRVMQQILDTGGVQGVTPTDIYQRWWDFYNEKPGVRPEAFHCDDELVDGQGSLGAYPIQCPRPEGVLALTDPFDDPENNPDSYVPIGLFNRFDLAPLDGSTCGEYRIVFAKRSGLSNTNDRNLIIFEAMLPNPNPSCGIEGCRAVAQFWADLSEIDDPQQIRERVEDFYFVDAAGAGPVVHALNYGRRGGQIRTNQFMEGPNLWQLHEFKFDPECGGTACIRPVTLKDNPFAELFQDPSPWPGAKWFQKWFVGQVRNLETPDSNLFFTVDAGTFKSGASTSEGEFDNYTLQSGFGTAFRDAIEAAITKPGLTADHILNRATALSCSGCHEHTNFIGSDGLGDGLTWAPSLGFVHISEELIVEGPLGTRFGISDTLRFVFLPHRKKVLENFLAETTCEPCTQKSLLKFGKPTGKKFLQPGFTSTEGMTVGGPRSGH